MPDDVPPPDLAELRARIAGRQRGMAAAPGSTVSLGGFIDTALPGQGLARAAVHEILAGDPGAAVGFCACILARAGGTAVWIGSAPDLWPPGLLAFGLAPSRLVLVGARRPRDGLWALEEALRSPAVAAAVLVVEDKPPGLVAGRRLQLAAEAGGGLGVLLLPDTTGRGQPSAARTRWRVGSAPGARSGDPCWHLALLRASAGRPGAWLVAWDRAAQQLVQLCA